MAGSNPKKPFPPKISFQSIGIRRRKINKQRQQFKSLQRQKQLKTPGQKTRRT